MSFNPIGFVFPKSNIPEGGAGYTEDVTVLSSTELSFARVVEFPAYLHEPFTHPLEAKDGQRFKVVWDGVEYVCTAKRATVFDQNVIAIGNLVAAGYADTGEPFCVVNAYDIYTGVMVWAVYAFTDNPVTASVTAEVVHPIDPKYLPTKVVDLDAWGIGEVILSLFAQGGGQSTLTKTDAFWDALGDNTDVNVRMYLNYQGIVLEFDGVSKSHDGNNRWLQLSANILTFVDTLEYVPLIYLAIIRDGHNTHVVVRVQ